MSGDLVAMNKWMCMLCINYEVGVENQFFENGEEMMLHLKEKHGIKRKHIEFHGHHEWYLKEGDKDE